MTLVHIYELSGKEEIRYWRKEVKNNKHKRLLKRLIKEVRELRKLKK